MPDPKFWSDDFDMDLPKMVPDVREILREPGRLLWTVGHRTFGRLNHPTVWASYGAFLWFEKPNLERDENGWFRVISCVSDEEEVECTWLEFLRDAWCHSYETLILPRHVKLPAMPWPTFHELTYAARGFNGSTVQKARAKGREWVLECDRILNALIQEKQDARL